MAWKEIKIGDLGKVITGNTPLTSDRDNYGGPYPFIKPTDMEIDRRRVVAWEENYSQKAFKKFEKAYIPPRATGVVTIGTVGQKIFQADRWCFTNQSVNVVIPDEINYDPDFVYYLLKYNLPQVESANPGTASGRHHVSKSNFCSINVKVPALREQVKIGAILSAYDDLIENNLKRIKLLEELAQRTYEEWFVKFTVNGEALAIGEETGLPVGWERKKLVDVATLTMGQSPKSEFYNKDSIGIPFHQGVSDYGLRFPTNSTWSTEGSRYAESGDILFSVRAPVGRLNVAIEKLILGRGLASIRHKKNLTNYLFYQLQSIFFKDDLMGGGSIFNSVTKSDVERIQIIEAPKEITLAFNSFAKNVDMQIETLTKQSRLLKQSRDILLPRLMNGTINIEEAEESFAMAAEPEGEYTKA